MPAVLNSSKRKFHRLLDNLTSSSSTPSLPATSNSNSSVADSGNRSTTSLADPQPASKRARPSWMPSRRSRPSSIAGNGSGNSATSGLGAAKTGNALDGRSALRATVAGSSGSPHAKRGANHPPNYAPYSHERFLERLRTFAGVTTWTPKPAGLGEVEWAKNGWVCDGWNSVACRGGCNKRVVVRPWPRRKDREGRELENTEDLEGQDGDGVEVDEGIVRRFQELIVGGHGEDCLWRKGGCKGDIYRISMASPAVWQPALRDRYQSLLSIEQHLPTLLSSNVLPTAQDLIEAVPASILSTSSSPPPAIESSRAPNAIALQLAVHGWFGHNDANVPISRCQHCFQRLGLWLYSEAKIRQYSGGGRGDDESTADALRLNPVTAHRLHCPWRNPESQAGIGDFAGLAAWEILWRVISNGQKMNKRRADALAADDMEEGVSEGRTLEVDGGFPTSRRASTSSTMITATTTTAMSNGEDVEMDDRRRFSRLAAVKKAFNVKRLPGGAGGAASSKKVGGR